jgi:hypothetical protein
MLFVFCFLDQDLELVDHVFGSALKCFAPTQASKSKSQFWTQVTKVTLDDNAK